MACGIYMIRNTANGKVYDGSSVNIEQRWMEHKLDLKKGIHYNYGLQKDWNKYSAYCFEFSVLEECIEEVLTQRETAWIKQHNSMDRRFGYNIAFPDRHKISEETKQKLSASLIGRKHTKEHNDNVSKALTGRKLSKEHIEKMRITSTGRKVSEETRQKLSKLHKGKEFSKEHKDSLKKAWLNRSRTLSEEHKSKLSKAHKGKILSEETKKKIGIAVKGKTLGIKRSPLTIERLRLSHIGKLVGVVKSQETINKMRLAQRLRRSREVGSVCQ